MQIRNYKSTDCDEILHLFYNTVHAINKKDYTEDQLNVWAGDNMDIISWNETLLVHDTIVSEIDGKIVGFGDLKDDFIDHLFVHKDYQRQGIATFIAEELEQRAYMNGKRTIITYASITARPFFQKRGYVEIKKQQVEREGLLLTNFVMKKQFA